MEAAVKKAEVKEARKETAVNEAAVKGSGGERGEGSGERSGGG
jgi:hypothetical protein